MQPEMTKEFKALQKENVRLKKNSRRAGVGYGDSQGSREGKLASPER